LIYYFLKLDCNPLLAFYERFLPNKDKLKNKTVWIVGASTGIGEQLAYGLSELNCRLILTSTTESKLKIVKENCLKKASSLKDDDIMVLPYDISNFEQNDIAFKQIIDKFGNIDVVVNNSARIFTSKVTEDDFELTRKLFDINYFSHIYITKLIIQHWLAIGSSGQILVTSSVGSYFDFPFFAQYTATKRSMNAFYRDVAQQQQKNNIYVSIVCPGPLKTELENKSFEINKRKTNFGGGHAMESKRCSDLMIISLANRLNECWITFQPMLLLTYVSSVFHYQIHFIFRLFNVSKIVENKLLK